MTEQLPPVTIGIPTRNRLSFLKEAVASALSQTWPNVEILLSQDPDPAGLDHGVHGWCIEVSKRDSHVSYRFNQRILGLAGNWNAIARAAKGEFLILIGDDDRLLPEFVEKLMQARRENTRVLFSNHYFMDEEGRRCLETTRRLTVRYGRHLLQSGPIEDAEAAVWRNSVPASASLIRTSDVRRLEFKEDLNTPEIEFFMRLARERAEFVFSSEYLSEYRMHPHSATADGLALDCLVKYLIPIQVSKHLEPLKRALLGDFLIGAASRCLALGNLEEARKWVRHPYYPRYRITRPVVVACQLAASLPGKSGLSFYRALRKLKTLIIRSHE